MLSHPEMVNNLFKNSDEAREFLEPLTLKLIAVSHQEATALSEAHTDEDGNL